MALTTIKTGAIADDAITTDKLANAINTERTANTAKDLTALSASNLTSGTVPDARFPATLPAASAANLTSIPAGNLTGTVADARFPATLPAASAANLTSIPAANITGTLPAISGANLTGISSAGKATNLIINGAMEVAQRLDTATTSSTSSGIHAVDRFALNFGGTDESPTQSQSDVASGTTPYTLGFRKAYKVQNGNQSSGAGTNDYIYYQYKVEAKDLATSGWNYSSSNVTLSFWVKSSVAQNFHGYILSDDGTQRIYRFETGSLTADTWTKITKTIPGDSNLTFNNDNGKGLSLVISQFWGTYYTTSSASLNTWDSFSSPGTDRQPDMTSTWYTTNDATFELTGVQLEVGDSATDFAHEQYAITKLRCQRYFNRPCCGMFHSTQSNADDHGIIRGFRYSTYGGINYCYPIEMRSNPTLTFDEMRDSDGSNTNITEQTGTQHISIFMLANNPYIGDMRLDAEL